MDNYGALMKYRGEYGNCLVPRGYDMNPALASWVAEQRYVQNHPIMLNWSSMLNFYYIDFFSKQYQRIKAEKKSTLTPERVDLLKGLNFEWNAQEAAWSRHLTNLKKFNKDFGHCHVPLTHPDFPKLGLWVKEQRRHYSLMKQGKRSHMTLERSVILDEVGFCWDTQEATWLARVVQLRDYMGKHGDCNGPMDWEEDPTLYHWAMHQHQQYNKFLVGKSKQISDEHIKKLDDMGFCWSITEEEDEGSEEGS